MTDIKQFFFVYLYICLLASFFKKNIFNFYHLSYFLFMCCYTHACLQMYEISIVLQVKRVRLLHLGFILDMYVQFREI